MENQYQVVGSEVSDLRGVLASAIIGEKSPERLAKESFEFFSGERDQG